MKLFRIAVALAFAAIAAGCATPAQMGLKRDSKVVDTSRESLLLLSAHLANQYRPSFQPNAFVVYIEKPGAKDAADRLNFLADDEGRNLGDSGSQFLFRMSLPPGKYVLRGIGGFSGGFPVRGNFFVPLHIDIEVAPGTVAYLGRVNAVMRERKESEFRAGAPFPLLDQAVTGYGGGTWEIDIQDQADADVGAMKRVFPALQPVEVRKMLLPAWNRAKAQEWWEKN